MLKVKCHRSNLSLKALGMAMLAAGFSGCNQSVEPAARGDHAGPSAQLEHAVPGPDNSVSLEGHVLKGEELAVFLKRLGNQPPASPAPERVSESGPAAKSAANPTCQINFNSNKGLSHMADAAYTNYATSPWYMEPCFPYYAFVTPSIGTHYYLPTEASGTCPGSYGQIGYGTIGNCTNQQNAANFPRYAAKASPSDGDMALVVTLPQDGVNHAFNASVFFARAGIINVYGLHTDGSWQYWGPVDASASPTFGVLSGGTNLTALYFFASTTDGLFEVDNISIVGQ
jgi:hypothetical protein